MTILINVMLGVHILVCLLMLLLTLMQRPRSEGLGAAFGSGMTENIFGAQTTNVLAKMTTWLGGGFFAITLLLAILYAKASSGPTRIQREIMKAKAEAAAPAASPSLSPAAPLPASPPVEAPAASLTPAPASPAPSASQTPASGAAS